MRRSRSISANSRRIEVPQNDAVPRDISTVPRLRHILPRGARTEAAQAGTHAQSQPQASGKQPAQRVAAAAE
jgi:hypothetical protein